MDKHTLYPEPKTDRLKEEIEHVFKLHCGEVSYDANGIGIDKLLNESNQYNEHLKAGKVAVDVMKDSLITTNHIERIVDSAIDFETDPVEYINRNKYIQDIKDVDNGLYNLIYNALNNGVFFRNAKTRRSFNYWQPLSNAGIPAVPRPDAIHETTFLVHDILHNLIPDLQLSHTSKLHKAVYIVHRVLGEGICLVLADMYFTEALSSKVDYDFDAKNIHQAFKHIKHRDLYTNLKANALYAVTGDKSGFGELNEGIEKYLEWFRPVYISDLKWTLHNIEDISSKFSTYNEWFDCFAPLINHGAYKVCTTHSLISALNIKESESIHSIAAKIFDCIFVNYIKCNLNQVNSTSKSERALKAKTIFYSFQGRILFDMIDKYEDKDILKKYTSAVMKKEFECAQGIYDYFVYHTLYKGGFISEDDLRLFREVYPHFNSYFISYNADVVVQDTLRDYSEELFNKLMK